LEAALIKSIFSPSRDQRRRVFMMMFEEMMTMAKRVPLDPARRELQRELDAQSRRRQMARWFAIEEQKRTGEGLNTLVPKMRALLDAMARDRQSAGGDDGQNGSR
jgi:hypothetical protein